MPRESPSDDRIRMRHMLDAAQEALAFSRGRGRSDLDTDRMYRRAVVHCLQEIGEAADRVSPAGRALAPSVPWHQIVGMRHRLVHNYFDINGDLVWEVIARDLVPLVDALQPAVDSAANPPEQSPPL
jgi:uncharacterized protein with HEPN domain